MHRSKSRVSKISQLRTERYQPPKTLVLPRSNAWAIRNYTRDSPFYLAVTQDTDGSPIKNSWRTPWRRWRSLGVPLGEEEGGREGGGKRGEAGRVGGRAQGAGATSWCRPRRRRGGGASEARRWAYARRRGGSAERGRSPKGSRGSEITVVVRSPVARRRLNDSWHEPRFPRVRQLGEQLAV